MDQDALRNLSSGDEEQRYHALRQIQDELVTGQLTPSALQAAFSRLRVLVLTEKSPTNRVLAIGILLFLQTMPPHFVGTRATSPLAEWLWRPFKKKSVVLRVRHPERVRDEDAVIEMARYLSLREFENTVFLRLPLDEQRWLEATRGIAAVCLVGRPGIFDDHVFDVLDSKQTRFHFPHRWRPDGLGPGEIDPDGYHQIRERTLHGEELALYKTKQDNQERTDYALVQSYLQHFVNRKLLVLICAGCTTLGTLGAARWLVDLDNSAMPLPSLPDREFCCEALLEVRADIPEVGVSWQPKVQILHKFILGNRAWDPESSLWQQRAPDEITLEYHEGAPKAIYFDGEKSPLHFGSQTFNYLFAICQLAHDRPMSEIRLSDLHAHRLITADLQSHLNNEHKTLQKLRKSLGNAFVIGVDAVRLKIPVQLLHAHSRPGSTRSAASKPRTTHAPATQRSKRRADSL